MVIQGHVENGKIVLDEEVPLAEGMKVRIELLTTAAAEADESTEAPTLYERLKPIIGIVKDLPPDASERIDEYLYGKSDH